MTPSSNVSTYTMLTTENDNQTKSPVFMAVYFTVYIVMPVSMLSMIALAFVDVVVNTHDANLGGLGGGLASMLGGLGVFVSGMALLLAQDKKPDAAPSIQHTSTTTATGESAIAAAAPSLGEDNGQRKAKAKP